MGSRASRIALSKLNIRPGGGLSNTLAVLLVRRLPTGPFIGGRYAY